MSSLSDEKLIKSCISGNRQHCRLLYERYKQYVGRIIWNFVEDVEATQDLTQETFLRVFKGLKKFKGRSFFKTWLYRIALNLCKDHLRRAERKHEKSQVSLDDLKDGGGKELPAKDPATDPHRQLLQNELKVVVDAAMDKLSMDHKTAILLWQEGLSYSEIAEITSTPEKTVGSRIYHAKMQLRDFLKPYLQGRK